MADLRKAARARLGALHGHAAKIDAAEKRILESAMARIDQITAHLDKLRPRVLLDKAAADKYTELVEERGKLNIVVAQARQNLNTT